MTSKEYLKQIATTEVIDCTYNDNSKKRIADIFSVGISVIEKDLEILDILKNESDSKRIIERDGIVSFHLDMILTTDNYNKIKEWLNNDWIRIRKRNWIYI